MRSLRFADIQTHPTEVVDLTSLTLTRLWPIKLLTGGHGSKDRGLLAEIA
jgi:hypothetical protein